MQSDPGIAAWYLKAFDSFRAFASTLSSDDWSAPMACTPAWTARDLLSHVTGLADDALNGRMDGAPGDQWTASQVERNRDFTVEDLLRRWADQVHDVAAMLERVGEGRPPIDCHSHEHDLRHALGRPGNRGSEIVEYAGTALAVIDCPVRLTIEFSDGRQFVSGSGENGSLESLNAVGLRGMTPFEMFRSRIGRRSLDQIRSADWTGSDDDIDAVIDRWFVFGPSAGPIVE